MKRLTRGEAGTQLQLVPTYSEEDGELLWGAVQRDESQLKPLIEPLARPVDT